MISDTLVEPLAVFVSGVTAMGPEVLIISPKLDLEEELQFEISMKCLPMKANCGDSLTVTIGDFFAVCLILLVPPFENNYDERDKLVSLGLLFDKKFNTFPYQTVLEGMRNLCINKKIMSLQLLKNIVPKLYDMFTDQNINSFSVKEGDIELTFNLDKDKLLWKEGLNEMKSGTYYESILSLDQIMEREKTAFMLDKFILKLITNEGPITIEDIMRKTIPLETVMGSKIEFNVILETCEKYVKKGLIKKVEVK